MRLLVALGATGVALLTAGAGVAAAAAPVPCSPGKVINGLPTINCQFYTPGDGISGGTPVMAADGTRVGFLRKGSNFVLCQRVGATVRVGRYFNNNWAATVADNRKFGWVNAVHARGGDSNGAFGGGVPVGCNPSAGDPPGGTITPPVNDPNPLDERFRLTLAYIRDEIQTNANGTIVKRIFVDNARGRPADRVAAAARWAKQVRPNGPWDHKPLLKRKFNLVNEDDFFMSVPDTASRVFYDLWSNIHYGYVGRVAGFSTRALLVGQNVPIVTGEHSPADDLKVMIGIQLYDRYPLAELTTARIQSAIVANLPRLQELDPVWSVRPRR